MTKNQQEPSTRGQRRRAKALRNKAVNPPKYHVGTLLVKEVRVEQKNTSKGGVEHTIHKTHLQAHKIMK